MKGPASAPLGRAEGSELKTMKMTGMEMAESTAMMPPQTSIVIRAQLRRRRTPRPAKKPKIAMAIPKSQKTSTAASVPGGMPGVPSDVFSLGATSIETSTNKPSRTPNALKMIATTPAAVTAGRDSLLTSLLICRPSLQASRKTVHRPRVYHFLKCSRREAKVTRRQLAA
jgi:hypothetical protein